MVYVATTALNAAWTKSLQSKTTATFRLRIRTRTGSPPATEKLESMETKCTKGQHQLPLLLVLDGRGVRAAACAGPTDIRMGARSLGGRKLRFPHLGGVIWLACATIISLGRQPASHHSPLLPRKLSIMPERQASSKDAN